MNLAEAVLKFDYLTLIADKKLGVIRIKINIVILYILLKVEMLRNPVF